MRSYLLGRLPSYVSPEFRPRSVLPGQRGSPPGRIHICRQADLCSIFDLSVLFFTHTFHLSNELIHVGHSFNRFDLPSPRSNMADGSNTLTQPKTLGPSTQHEAQVDLASTHSLSAAPWVSTTFNRRLHFLPLPADPRRRKLSPPIQDQGTDTLFAYICILLVYSERASRGRER